MSQANYENIQPLIAEQNVDGAYLKCVFRCPETGQEHLAKTHITIARSTGKEVKKAVKRGLFRGLRNSITRAVSSSVGSGMVGQAAREATYSATSGVGGRADKPSKEDIERAAVAAFDTVRDKFRWDDDGNRWLGFAPEAVDEPAPAAAGAALDFEQQLAAHPVTEKYDQGVMGRMLVEIACADGSVGDEEREFLVDFLAPELGTVDEVAARSRLSNVELEEVSAGGVRENLLMLGWSVALSDEKLDAAEEERLGAFASAFGVSEERGAEIKDCAARFLLNGVIASAYPDGRRDEVKRAEAMLFAAKLGIPSDQMERAEIQYRKRMGIM